MYNDLVKQWLAFVSAGLIWGASFLWIKIAVAEIGPFTLVALRLLLALMGLLIIMLWKRKSFPKDRKTLLSYLFMGIVYTALPFTLVAIGEVQIDSSLASILNATVPLFTIVIAHFWLHDEKITPSRLGGLIIGFIGVIVLLAKDINLQNVGNVWGQLAVVAAAASYGTAATFSRRYLRNQNPIIQSTMTVLFADAIMWIVTPIVEWPIHIPVMPMTWIAIAWLGLLGSFVAYLFFFYLINSWGPTRTTLLTYIFPVVGLILGIIFLGEKLDWNLALGSILIVAGIIVVNFKQFVFKKI